MNPYASTGRHRLPCPRFFVVWIIRFFLQFLRSGKEFANCITYDALQQANNQPESGWAMFLPVFGGKLANF
jgi:hypothetical protein